MKEQANLHRGREPHCPFNRILAGLKRRMGSAERNLLSLPGIELRPHSRPSCNLVYLHKIVLEMPMKTNTHHHKRISNYCLQMGVTHKSEQLWCTLSKRDARPMNWISLADNFFQRVETGSGARPVTRARPSGRKADRSPPSPARVHNAQLDFIPTASRSYEMVRRSGTATSPTPLHCV
jgi:hypothetical protein